MSVVSGQTRTAPNGALYIVNSSAHYILSKASLFDNATVYAGVPNTPGLVDGPRANAKFNRPMSVDFDAAGNVYIADRNNTALRVVSLSGKVSTRPIAGFIAAAGAANMGLWGIAVSPTTIFFTDNVNQVIWAYTQPSGPMKVLAGAIGQRGSTNGRGSAARFNNPQDCQLSPDGLILNVVDLANNAVRQVTPAGDVNTVMANAPG